METSTSTALTERRIEVTADMVTTASERRVARRKPKTEVQRTRTLKDGTVVPVTKPTVAPGVIEVTLKDGSKRYRATAYVKGVKTRTGQHATLKKATDWQGDQETEMRKVAKANGKHLGGGVVPSKLPMSEVFRLYEETAPLKGMKLSARTLSTTRRLAKHPKLKDVYVEDMSIEVIEAFSAYRKAHDKGRGETGKVQAQSINMDYVRIGKAIKCCASWFGWGNYNPLGKQARIELESRNLIAKSKERERRPSAYEMRVLMAHFRAREKRLRDGLPARLKKRDGSGNANAALREIIPMADIVEYAVTSAMRQGEICRIRWADIVKGVVINCWRKFSDSKEDGKNAGRRFCAVPVGPDPMSVVNRQPRIPGEARIFPYDEMTISRAFSATVAKLHAAEREMAIANGAKNVEDDSLPFHDLRFHDLRHEAISTLAKIPGMTPSLLKRISGHKSLASLERYINGTQEEAEEIALMTAGMAARTALGGAANDEQAKAAA